MAPTSLCNSSSSSQLSVVSGEEGSSEQGGAKCGRVIPNLSTKINLKKNKERKRGEGEEG